MPYVNDIAIAHHHHALHDVEQFTHIARPSVADQPHHGWFGDGWNGPAKLCCEPPRGVIDQSWHIFASLTQWWHVNLGSLDSEIQVVTELAAGHHRFELLIGGADKAHLGLAGLVRA